VSTIDVRSDLSYRQNAGGMVNAENLDIVADEADGASGGAVAISASALELRAN
jgi:hypothetical protein